MFRNILVCVDQSPESDAALAQAIDLADCQRSRLTILTAMTRPPGWASPPMATGAGAPLAAELARAARETLERAVRRVPDRIPVTKILSEDPIREALTARLTHADHDLVVLGSHGRGALAASLHRSVSRYALRHCHVPVLTVRTVRTEGESEPERGESQVPAIAVA